MGFDSPLGYNMNKTNNYILALGLGLWAVGGCLISCSSDNDEQPYATSDKEVILSPRPSEMTKAPITGDLFPTGRTIFLSASMRSTTLPDDEWKDYFVGNTFKYSSTDELWHNFEGTDLKPIYKPIGYELNYLGYSTEKTTSELNPSTAVFWGDDMKTFGKKNVGGSLYIDYPDNYMYPGEKTQDDLLFCSLRDMTTPGAKALVDAEMRHAQAWLKFKICTKNTKDIKINSISLEKAYTSGIFYVNNMRSLLNAEWNFSEEEKGEKFILNYTNDATTNVIDEVDQTEFEAVALGTYIPVGDKGILVPEQPRCRIKVVYTMYPGKTYEKVCTAYTDHNSYDMWYMGKIYEYQLNLTAGPDDSSSLSWTVTVKDWIKIEADWEEISLF